MLGLFLCAVCSAGVPQIVDRNVGSELQRDPISRARMAVKETDAVEGDSQLPREAREAAKFNAQSLRLAEPPDPSDLPVPPPPPRQPHRSQFVMPQLGLQWTTQRGYSVPQTSS